MAHLEHAQLEYLQSDGNQHHPRRHDAQRGCSVILKAIIIALPLMLTGQMSIQPARAGSGVAQAPCTSTSAWAMNEGTGTTFVSTPAGNNMTTTGSFTWTSNELVSGTSSPVWGGGSATAANDTLTNFDGTTPFSVGMWTKLTQLSPFTIIGDANGSSPNVGWNIWVENSNHQIFVDLVNNVSTNLIQVRGLGRK